MPIASGKIRRRHRRSSLVIENSNEQGRHGAAFALSNTWLIRDRLRQKPRVLHIAQWSQGLPPGSTLQVFSFSK